MKRYKIIFDMFLNIVATSVPTFVLQLIILPLFAQEMSDDRYGLLVTIIALLDVVPATMGNVLNNIRLLYNDQYQEQKLEGDFNVLLLILAGIDLIVVCIFTYSYDHTITIFNLFMTLAISVVWLAKEYFIVAFRLKINYKAILINNLLQVVGYGLGFILFHYTGCWQFVYLIGYIVSLVYIFTHCNLWKGQLKITSMFKNITWQGTLLLISTLLSRVITYADRLLIYPILGGAVVSVYYAATVFGKAISLMINPINSVVLTYLSKLRKKTDNMFNMALLLGIGVCAIGYIICILISRPILTIIYPQFVDEAMNYIYLTTGTAILSALIGLINPFILKFFDMKWQIAINGGTVIVYVALCMTLLHFWGLYGFCIGALITNFLKLIFMLLIYKRCNAIEA